MIRGDDDLFSIMDEMSNRSKPKLKDYCDAMSAVPTSSPRQQVRIRMVPEVEGYGKEEGKYRYCPENGCDGSIWNPYVHVSFKDKKNSTRNFGSFMASTSPTIEIARRRSYEKFKRNFYNAFKFEELRPLNDKGDSKTKKSSAIDELIKSTWRKLPAHSILERYHFACKTEETFQIIDNRAKNKDGKSELVHPPKNFAIGQIAKFMNAGVEEGLLMEPILLSPFQRHRSHHSLLKNEIQFQFFREFKRLMGGTSSATDGTNGRQKKELKDLDDFFLSSSFQRRCTKIGRRINDIAIEAENDFRCELNKKALESLSNNTHSRKGKRKGIPKLSLDSTIDKVDGHAVESFSLTFSGLSFRIGKAHFEKLQILFDRHNTASKSIQEHQSEFYRSLFSLLARYDAMEGAGLQSSLNGNVFDVLLNHFQCSMECFASPFNCRYERFCSAFEDTDTPFGSLGSFFDFNFKELGSGCFQANPPFASDFILHMCKRMEGLLSDDSLPPFMFIVFVPAWQDSQGWQALSNAESLVHHLLLSQKDPHYYCEGTQHRRLKGRYRIASFDTSVFFMQNHAAKCKWPIKEEMLKELLKAFGSKPEHRMEKVKEEPLPVEELKASNEEHVSTSVNKKEHQPAKRKRSNNKMQQKDGQKMNKKARKKKKLVSDDEKSQLAILSSLGIAPVDQNEKEKIAITMSKKKSKKQNNRREGQR